VQELARSCFGRAQELFASTFSEELQVKYRRTTEAKITRIQLLLKVRGHQLGHGYYPKIRSVFLGMTELSCNIVLKNSIEIIKPCIYLKKLIIILALT